MATETFYTPQAPARWVHLINARVQLDPNKPKAWSVDLVLDNSNPQHKAFLEKLDQIFVETHGSKKKRSDKGQPWKVDKDDSNKTIVKFKSLEFVRDDGSKASGPRIVDAKKQAWDGNDIGNGSEIIVAFTVYGWERPEGTGLSLQPKAVQVIQYVAREEVNAADGFAEQTGYSVSSQPTSGYVDEFGGEEAPF
jgi:hypothetical protein